MGRLYRRERKKMYLYVRVFMLVDHLLIGQRREGWLWLLLFRQNWGHWQIPVAGLLACSHCTRSLFQFQLGDCVCLASLKIKCCNSTFCFVWFIKYSTSKNELNSQCDRYAKFEQEQCSSELKSLLSNRCSEICVTLYACSNVQLHLKLSKIIYSSHNVRKPSLWGVITSFLMMK